MCIKTCHKCLCVGSYPERAMPSAGMIPFLQSSVCTIDNNCSKQEETLQRASAQQRFVICIDASV